MLVEDSLNLAEIYFQGLGGLKTVPYKEDISNKVLLPLKIKFSNIVLLCCSIAITLIFLDVAEYVYLRVTHIDMKSRRIEKAKTLGLPFDDRPKKMVVDQLRSQGIEAYPVITPKFLLSYDPERRFLPLGHISHKIVVLDNEDGVYELFTTDEHGFRNPLGSWSQRTDILIVGDSYAMGAECA